MAVTLGTSSGFVTVAPSANPSAGGQPDIDGSSVVTKDTSPSTPMRITSIGWYKGASTNTANWQIALYSDNAGVADVRLEIEATNSTSSAGWVSRSVNWTISPSTAYWLGLQMDAHVGVTGIGRDTSGGAGFDIRTGQTALNNPYGGGAVAQPAGLAAIYALVEPLFSPAWGAKATTIIGGVF